MNSNTQNKNGKSFSIKSVTQAGSRLAYLTITIDVQNSLSSINPATGLIFGDVLMSGTKNKTKDQFNDALKKLGAKIKIEISNGLCTVTMKSTKQNLKKSLTLLDELLTAPALATAEIKRAITTTTNTLDEQKDNSRLISHNELKRELFPKGDRRHEETVITLSKQVRSVSKRDLRLLLRTVRSSFWYVSTAGNSAVNKTIAESKLLSKKITGDTVHAYKTSIKNAKKLVLNEVSSRQNIDLSIGAVLPLNVHHEDYPALIMGLAVLGKWGGFAGRLMTTVREKEGLTYGIYAKTEGVYRNELCYWRIMTFFAPNKTIQGLTSTFREINKIYSKGVTKRELDLFKTILKTQLTLTNDSLGGKLDLAHHYHLQGLSELESETYQKRIQTLSVKEINDAIKKYLDPKRLTISCAGPIKAVKKDLERFAESV